MSEKKTIVLALVSSLLLIGLFFALDCLRGEMGGDKPPLKVGFLFEGDKSTAYTDNFIRAQREAERKFGQRIQVFVQKNVADEAAPQHLQKLVDEGCQLIFANSYNFETDTKAMAEKYPKVQFCQANGDNGSLGKQLANYHTYAGEIYEGRYVTGVVAGLKLKQLIHEGRITPWQAKIGYVASYHFAEVISGYTAFLLGIHSQVPQAVMHVRYINSWNDYNAEKEAAEKLIDEGCIVISHHSDTVGPAVACEQSDPRKIVYHVGYTQNMKTVAPTTTLVSSRINWTPYILGAVEAVLEGKPIEKTVKGNVHGNDVGGGFAEGWVEMMHLNERVAAPDTQKKIDEVVGKLKRKEIQVFSGNYIGVHRDKPEETWDLRTPFKENENASAPSFDYVLKDYVVIE